VEREPNIFKKLPNEDIKEIIRMTDLRGTEQLNTNDTLQSTYSSSEKKQPFSLIWLQRCGSLHEADFADVCNEKEVTVSIKSSFKPVLI